MARASDYFGLGDYTGPFISKAIVTAWTDLLAPGDPKFSKLVIESLSHFLPPPKYLQTHVKSECGVFIGELTYWTRQRTEKQLFKISGHYIFTMLGRFGLSYKSKTGPTPSDVIRSESEESSNRSSRLSSLYTRI